MPWLDDLLEADIGGAPFFAVSVRSSGGRRTVVTEFPGRDEAAAEDLGQRSRRWSVEAVVIGAAYMQARDAVVDVLERAGPHRFTHPWWGEAQVVVDGPIEVSESAAEGGVARISFSLAEVGTAPAFKIVPSPVADLGASVVYAKEVAAADFAKATGGLGGVLAAIAAGITAVASAMTKVHRKALAAFGGVDTLTYALLDFDEARDALAALPDALMAKINGLLAALGQVIRDSAAADPETYPGSEKVQRVEQALQAAEELHAVDVATDTDDEDEQAAEAAFNLAFRALSVATFAELFQDLPLESTDQSAAVLTSLGGALEDLLLEPTLSDEAYDALTDLRSALAEQARAAAQTLPSLTTYTPTSATPALLIAFWLYGDPGRDLEIVARNSVADPNFVPGLVPLEVLSG